MAPHDTCQLHRGHTPLLISLPHVGTFIPDELRPAFTERALAVEDTDWLLAPLYDFARALGASLLVPHCSRYVIDLNRPPANTPMYPGANNTELCPTRHFTGDAIYRPGQAPDEAAIAERRSRYWQPYHDTLAGELQRLRAEHGHALLFDGHSIHPELPWLFEGRLPDLNLGTAEGRSCAPGIRQALAAVLAGQQRYTQVVDGRFKGGYITRHHGQPEHGVHAVQLEMAWTCYLRDGLPAALDPARVALLQPLLQALLQALLDWQPEARP